MIVEAHKLIPPGFHVLWRGGVPVWYGKLGMPIEDVECDKIQVSPEDYERIAAVITPSAD